MKGQRYAAECVHLTAKRSCQEMKLLIRTDCAKGLSDWDITKYSARTTTVGKSCQYCSSFLQHIVNKAPALR